MLFITILILRILTIIAAVYLFIKKRPLTAWNKFFYGFVLVSSVVSLIHMCITGTI